jgi:diacylglycerol kinase family enzyme
MRQALLIANPKAGRGGPKRRQEAIREFCRLMEARGIRVEVEMTTAPRDAARLSAAAAREGFPEVIVSGGDGTINEALQGLIGTSVRLAIWPRGTANVLGGELRLPRRLDRLADVLAAGKVQRAYAACATIENTGEQRYFLLMAGIGMDAAIIDLVRPTLKERIGVAAFWLSGLESLARWHPKRFVVEIEGRQYPATFASLGKTPRYGGSLTITPRARLEKPEFEICLIDSRHRRKYLQLLPFAMFGGIPEGLKGTCFVSAAEVRAIGEGVPVQVDGEVIGTLPMSFRVTSHVVELVTR